MNLQPGAWGGGNQFGHSLVDYLRDREVELFFDLDEADLDLILLTEPRSHLKTSAYSDKEIARYLLGQNRQAIVVHRINECDERKGTKGVNRRLRRANYWADHTVFISHWLQDLFLGHGWRMPGYSVILNGANPEIFNAAGYGRWQEPARLKLVTHHWGAGYLKGFDIYERLDLMLSESVFGQKIEFTYIGNLPRNFRFRAAHYLPPQTGRELAQSIRRHHVYLTASQNEPAGMHHIEGASCGLPLLYRDCGALPEYCRGFGVSFSADNFERKLQEMMETYDHWADRMADYPHTAERMCVNYYDLFLRLLDQRDKIVKRRQRWRRPDWVLRALV